MAWLFPAHHVVYLYKKDQFIFYFSLTGLINATGAVEVVGLDQIPVDETQNGEKTANGTAVIEEPSKNLISGQVI